MTIPEQAIDAAQDEIGADLAAGVGNDEDQRRIIRAAIEAAAPHLAVRFLLDHLNQTELDALRDRAAAMAAGK